MSENLINQTILLFCQYYPYTGGEQFLFNEAEYYPDTSEINVFTQNSNGKPCIKLPPNFKIHQLDFNNNPPVRKILRLYWKLILKVFYTELIYSPHRSKYIINFKINLFLLIGYLQKAYIINKQLPNIKNIKLYSYWFDENATIIHLVKKISKRHITVICRIHAYDFDEAQVKSGYHLFRYFDLIGYDNIISVSNYGKQYIHNRYNFSKVKVNKLGVRNIGDNPYIKNSYKTIISCSSLVPIKRIHLIILLLNEMKDDIKWIHFGDGPLMKELKENCTILPNNVNFELRGQVENKEILNYYQKNMVDLFINVSELEGIPVSLMEAISFGIPILGCNICGVPEIVNEQTGILLEKDFDFKESALQIESFLVTKSVDKEFRKGVKEFWNLNYNADKNYPQFINQYLLN